MGCSGGDCGCIDCGGGPAAGCRCICECVAAHPALGAATSDLTFERRRPDPHQTPVAIAVDRRPPGVTNVLVAGFAPGNPRNGSRFVVTASVPGGVVINNPWLAGGGGFDRFVAGSAGTSTLMGGGGSRAVKSSPSSSAQSSAAARPAPAPRASSAVTAQALPVAKPLPKLSAADAPGVPAVPGRLSVLPPPGSVVPGDGLRDGEDPVFPTRRAVSPIYTGRHRRDGPRAGQNPRGHAAFLDDTDPGTSRHARAAVTPSAGGRPQGLVAAAEGARPGPRVPDFVQVGNAAFAFGGFSTGGVPEDSISDADHGPVDTRQSVVDASMRAAPVASSDRGTGARTTAREMRPPTVFGTARAAVAPPAHPGAPASAGVVATSASPLGSTRTTSGAGDVSDMPTARGALSGAGPTEPDKRVRMGVGGSPTAMPSQVTIRRGGKGGGGGDGPSLAAVAAAKVAADRARENYDRANYFNKPGLEAIAGAASVAAFTAFERFRSTGAFSSAHQAIKRLNEEVARQKRAQERQDKVDAGRRHADSANAARAAKQQARGVRDAATGLKAMMANERTENNPEATKAVRAVRDAADAAKAAAKAAAHAARDAERAAKYGSEQAGEDALATAERLARTAMDAQDTAEREYLYYLHPELRPPPTPKPDASKAPTVGPGAGNVPAGAGPVSPVTPPSGGPKGGEDPGGPPASGGEQGTDAPGQEDLQKRCGGKASDFCKCPTTCPEGATCVCRWETDPFLVGGGTAGGGATSGPGGGRSKFGGERLSPGGAPGLRPEGSEVLGQDYRGEGGKTGAEPETPADGQPIADDASGASTGENPRRKRNTFKSLSKAEQIIELAKLSSLVYGVDAEYLSLKLVAGEPVYLDTMGPSGDEPVWKVLVAGASSSGLKYATVSYGDGGQVVTVFAGTEIGSDFKRDMILTNLPQGIGFVPKQYQEAARIAFWGRVQYGDVIYTGHSLGGGLAEYAGMKTNSESCIFNPAPLGRGTLASLVQQYQHDPVRFNKATSKITRVSTLGDIVSVASVELAGSIRAAGAAGMFSKLPSPMQFALRELGFNIHLSRPENEIALRLEKYEPGHYALEQHDISAIVQQLELNHSRERAAEEWRAEVREWPNLLGGGRLRPVKTPVLGRTPRTANGPEARGGSVLIRNESGIQSSHGVVFDYKNVVVPSGTVVTITTTKH